MGNATIITSSSPVSLSPGVTWAWPYIAALGVLYLSACSYLRFRRRGAMLNKHGFIDRDSLKEMTNVQAQDITSWMGEMEFPRIYRTSIQFALFKTYGIPTISGLLVATKQFSTPENASKRYVDTEVLISEFTGHHPKSERVLKALARMNYIHSGYQKSGKISQDDLLYTLIVFITEPVSWINQYEWRKATDMEICAIATLWKSIGDAMGIEYTGRLSRSSWADGLEFYEDAKKWSEEYEKKCMVPAECNKITADELVPLLLFYVPGFARPFATNLIGVMMPPILRTAMSFPAPPKYMYSVASTIFTVRKLVLRYLALPRPSSMRVRDLPEPDKKTGRFHMDTYMSHPFYVPSTFWNRWGPRGMMSWAAGGDVPGDNPAMYHPDGYVLGEVGPERLRNKGGKEAAEIEEKLQRERPAGCPFAFAR